MIQQNEINILDQILLVDLSGIHLWTARRKLKPEMFEGKTPPSDLASLGSMRVIDPEKLKPFEKIKRKAIKVLEDYGIRFLGGYAIPQDKIQKVVDELEVLKSQFYDLKTNFMPNYDRWVKEWIDKDWERQGWRDAIERSVTPKAHVDAGIQFGYAACRVAPDGDKHLSATLGSQVRGLSDQLFAETAETAERLLESGLAARGHVTQTTLNTIRKMSTKLKGLMFLSSDVKALAGYIDDLIASLPKSGVVNGSQYNQVVTLISSLSDEHSIQRLIKNLNQANGNDGAFAPAEPETEVEQPKAQPEPVMEQPKAEPEAALVAAEVEEVAVVAQSVEEDELAGIAVFPDPFEAPMDAEDLAVTAEPQHPEDQTETINEVTHEPQTETEPEEGDVAGLVIAQQTPVSPQVMHGVFSF